MAFNEYIEPIKAGNYTVRLLKNAQELRQYQDLRYKYLICGFDPEKAKAADPDATDYNLGYDKETSQLCVFYKDPDTGKEEVVGGYILMRFHYDDQFCKGTLKYDLSKLFKKHKYDVLETTRAVTHPGHRDGSVMKLMWEGLQAYAVKYNMRFVIGTMSFLGLDPLKYSQAASYLHHHYLMPKDIMVTPAHHAYYHDIIPPDKIDRFAAIKELPALLKGFLMAGCQVGSGFYIDEDLKTVEIFAILDVQKRGHFRLK